MAVLAAAAFGATTPFVQRFGRDTGPFVTAGLLYLGASVGTVRLFAMRPAVETPLRGQYWRRIAAVAIFGAVVAPACFAWGLRHMSASSASLLLNFEAVFTLVFSALLYSEPIGLRVVGAIVLMLLGGGALAMGSHDASEWAILGMTGIVLATMGWAADNVLTRPLSEFDPAQVVRWKGVVGASLSFTLGFALGESIGTLAQLLALAVCGLTGYGLSLRLYLRAQRLIGAGRTGAIFAVAPFVGAAVAWALGDRSSGPNTVMAALLFAAAIYLHLTEQHDHLHAHDALEHEHAHRHDDGHHDHEHEPPVDYEHSHLHSHAGTTHSHEHGVDMHHRHAHEFAKINGSRWFRG
jgi:drug/metabolite transporter (DMT)-like permease